MTDHIMVTGAANIERMRLLTIRSALRLHAIGLTSARHAMALERAREAVEFTPDEWSKRKSNDVLVYLDAYLAGLNMGSIFADITTDEEKHEKVVRMRDVVISDPREAPFHLSVRMRMHWQHVYTHIINTHGADAN